MRGDAGRVAPDATATGAESRGSARLCLRQLLDGSDHQRAVEDPHPPAQVPVRRPREVLAGGAEVGRRPGPRTRRETYLPPRIGESSTLTAGLPPLAFSRERVVSCRGLCGPSSIGTRRSVRPSTPRTRTPSSWGLAVTRELWIRVSTTTRPPSPDHRCQGSACDDSRRRPARPRRGRPGRFRPGARRTDHGAHGRETCRHRPNRCVCGGSLESRAGQRHDQARSRIQLLDALLDDADLHRRPSLGPRRHVQPPVDLHAVSRQEGVGQVQRGR